MLQNFIFIPIDIFLDKLHNRGIRSKLDAWLTFLGCDEPDYIIELIEKYPKFKVMYSHLYDMCLNIEGVMHMFSKELQLMDQNTVRYMIDEYQEQVDTLTEKNEELTNTNNILSNELQDVKDVLKKYKEKFGNID